MVCPYTASEPSALPSNRPPLSYPVLLRVTERAATTYFKTVQSRTSPAAGELTSVFAQCVHDCLLGTNSAEAWGKRAAATAEVRCVCGVSPGPSECVCVRGGFQRAAVGRMFGFPWPSRPTRGGVRPGTRGLPKCPTVPPPPLPLVRHRDLWEQILWERERVGAVFLHPGGGGQRRGRPPDGTGSVGAPKYNLQSLPKRRRAEPQWEALGLEEMSSEEGEALDSGGGPVMWVQEAVGRLCPKESC